MKFNTLILTSSIVLLSACSSQSMTSDSSAQATSAASASATSALTEVASTLKNTLLADYAAKQLGLPTEQASAALGAVFKTAQGNLSTDDFATIGKAIPGVDSLIEQAPVVSALTGGGNLGYLDAAFKQIGVPKETVMPLVGTVTTYLDQAGMGSAAALLKQGLNFL